MDSTGILFPIERSSLYTAWLLEKQEVMRHKWVLSERAGYDVGWEAAKWNWDMQHRRIWVAEMQERGLWPRSA